MPKKKSKNYKVGYGKPPKKNQFKPGQSGNPRGRPKKSKNTFDILKRELDSQVSLKEGEKRVLLTKKQAMLRHLINKAVQGDIKAMFFVFGKLLDLDAKEEAINEFLDDISATDKKILSEFLNNSENKQKEKLNDNNNK